MERRRSCREAYGPRGGVECSATTIVLAAAHAISAGEPGKTRCRTSESFAESAPRFPGEGKHAARAHKGIAAAGGMKMDAQVKKTAAVLVFFFLAAAAHAQTKFPSETRNAALRYWLAFADLEDPPADKATAELLE